MREDAVRRELIAGHEENWKEGDWRRQEEVGKEAKRDTKENRY